VKRAEIKRSSRLLDLGSLILICAGGVLYLVAYLGMENLRTRPYEEFVPFKTEAFARTREYTRLTRTSRLGLALSGVGVLVALSAAAHAHIIGRRKENVPV
jgi:hypothetical protein